MKSSRRHSLGNPENFQGTHICIINNNIIIINVIYMAQIRSYDKNAANAPCQLLHAVLVYVIKSVFSRVRNADSDMSSRSAAGRLFHTVGPLISWLHLGVTSHAKNCEHRFTANI